MADHEIEAHFVALSTSGTKEKEERIIRLMAVAFAGEDKADHPFVIFEARKIYLAVKEMLNVMSAEDV